MDSLLLRYYNQELHHLREIGAEFSKAYPKIAARLGMDGGTECADPYVERLLEGFAFLAARVHLKLDAEFPRFTQHLLDIVYPHYLCPMPSMAIVQMQPDLMEGSLVNGFKVPRHTILRSRLGKGDQTPCEYRTAHEVTLWPIELIEAQYHSHLSEMPNFSGMPSAKSGIRLRLRTTAGVTCDQLALDKLPLHFPGNDNVALQLYEHINAYGVGIAVVPVESPASWYELSGRSAIEAMGFKEDEALLPNSRRSFSGYRLLQEYFAFPNRFFFVELNDLAKGLKRCKASEVDIVILLKRGDPYLEKTVNKSNFSMFCTPAVNLFNKKADRIHLSDQSHQYHIVADRSRPMDFEVYSIEGVEGYGRSSAEVTEFQPFYAASDWSSSEGVYYSVQRQPRMLSARQTRQGTRSSYLGSETYVSLVDATSAPFSTDLKQLSVNTLCTNRDLPLQMPVGHSQSDFSMEISAPISGVSCIAGPTKPRPSFVHGETAWRLVSHLSLNYLSLVDNDEQRGASALRELLMLYADQSDAATKKQVDGIRSIQASTILRRLPVSGPETVGRGLEIRLTLDDSAFEGSGVFVLGAVLDRFFAKYVSINSFTETVIATVERGEVVRWPARIGRRQVI